MKYAKYLLLSVLLLAVSACKNDPDVKSSSAGDDSRIGVYQNGKSLFLFNKEGHQLAVNPSEYVFRIQDNTGAKYVEVVLDAIPEKDVPTHLTLKNNMDLTDVELQDVVLLRSQKNTIWLWSPQTQMEFVLPWVEM